MRRNPILIAIFMFCAATFLSTSAHARFLQTDPVGYKDDINWYAYVGNDPTNKTDPMGLTPQDRVDEANRLAKANIPYRSGGGHGSNTDEKKGLDCSGLVMKAFAADPDNKLTVNGTASQLHDTFKSKGEFSSQMKDAQAGDAIFFKDSKGNIVHTGIVTETTKGGGLKFVDAPRAGKDVRSNTLKADGAYGRSATFAGVGRSIEAGGAAGTTANSGSGASTGFAPGGGLLDPTAGVSGSWD